MVTINLSGRAAESIEANEGIFIAVVIYAPDTDELSFVFPDTIDKEEGSAILRKFHCLPREGVKDL
jgi:hypothetical protein